MHILCFFPGEKKWSSHILPLHDLNCQGKKNKKTPKSVFQWSLGPILRKHVSFSKCYQNTYKRSYDLRFYNHKSKRVNAKIILPPSVRSKAALLPLARTVSSIICFHQWAAEVDDSYYFMLTGPILCALYILYRGISKAITRAGRAGMRNVSHRNISVTPSVLLRRYFEYRCGGSYDLLSTRVCKR